MRLFSSFDFYLQKTVNSPCLARKGEHCPKLETMEHEKSTHDPAPVIDYDLELRLRAEAFEQSTGRAPNLGDIRADPDWYKIHSDQKEIERTAAGSQRAGGCSSYIVRRRRFCSNAAADGLGGLCSEHFAIAAGEEPLSKLPVDAFQGVGKRNLKRRMKRMTNPSASQNLIPAEAPDWSAVFADPTLPLLLDIGCAKGRYLAQLAKSTSFTALYGPHNFCGVEIFAPLVQAANCWRDTEGLKNLHYVAGNINVSFAALRFPPTLAKVCIQFPDPWQDDNLAKRVVTPNLVADIARALPMGSGELFVVSDVKFLARDMISVVKQSGYFNLHPRHIMASTATVALTSTQAEVRHDGDDDDDDTPHQRGDEEKGDSDDDLCGMPIRPYCDIPTERDKVCEIMWRPIYRFLFIRNTCTVLTPAASQAPVE